MGRLDLMIDQMCVLRNYVRQRSNLIESASTHILRMQKALIQMNVQLHKVISDITGVTGMQIIKAIIEGERNPEKLSELRDVRIRNDRSIYHGKSAKRRLQKGTLICVKARI